MRNSHCSNNYQMHHRQGYQKQQGQLSPHASGAIFMCDNKTRKECFKRRVFGLPASREPFVRQVKEGMYLFLFGADDRRMCGVFKAASNGGMNIVHGAFRSSGCSYPAQVRFNIEYMYEPLTETEFRPAIQENYYTDVKFNFDLNSDQVQRLLVLFEAKKGSGVPQPISDRWDPSSSIDSPLNCSYSNRQRNIMLRMNNLGQRTFQVQITNPNLITGGSMLFMNSNSNFHQQGVVNATSLCLAQQQDYQTGSGTDTGALYTQTMVPHLTNNSSSQQQTQSLYCVNSGNQQELYQTGTGVMYAQTMVPHLAYNSSLQQQTQSLLCVNSGNQQVTLSGYNPLNLSSSQAVQVYAPNPLYPGNIIMGVSTSSNFYKGDDQVHNNGAHLHGQICNEAPQNSYYSNKSQDVGIVGDLKTIPLEENPCSDQNPTMVCSIYPSESGKQLDKNSNSDPNPNLRLDANLSLKSNPNPNPNPSLYSDVEQRKSVFSRLAQNPQIASKEMRSHLTGVGPSINQLPSHLIQQPRHQTGLYRADKPVYNKWVVQDEELDHIDGLTCADIELSPKLSGVVDGMDVDSNASISNLKVEFDESKLPLVDFKRKGSGNSLRTQLGGDKKKRRLIRPSLELKDEDSDLPSLKGPMHKGDMSSDKQSIEPFSVNVESTYSRETTVITGAMDVEGRVESGTSEVLLSPVCKTTEIFQTDVTILGFQDNHEEEKVLLNSIGMETAKGNQEFDRCQDTQGPLFKTEGCLQKLLGKTTVEFKRVLETKSNGSQKILVSESENPDTFVLEPKSLKEAGVNCSEGQINLLVLDDLETKSLKEVGVNCSEGWMESPVLAEKTEKKNPTPNPEPIISEPEIEVKDKSVLQPEPDNSKSLCLHNANDYIPLEPEADSLKTGIEEYIALEPGADNLTTILCLHDESMEKPVTYLEIEDQNYIALE